MWQKFVSGIEYIVDFLFPRSIVVQGGKDMPRITVAIINASTVLKDTEIAEIVIALQVQVSRDFAPIYGVDAVLVQVKHGQKPPAGAWQLVFFDDSDTAGALGYHDLTIDGMPLGKIFAKTDMHYGNLPSVTASHELLEMLADAGCELTVQVDAQTFTAYEVCDAVEDDMLGYPVVLPQGGTVKVSDFVYPAWFMASPPAGAKFDKCGHVSEPFKLAEGGYMSLWTPSKGWTQHTTKKDARRHPVGSRIEKRANRDQWRLSEVD